MNDLKSDNWIQLYIHWELSLIKELGFEINFLSTNNSELQIKDSIVINNKSFKIPKIFSKSNKSIIYNNEIKEALIFNKNLLMENFILPNRLKFPLFRNLLENYYA